MNFYEALNAALLVVYVTGLLSAGCATVGTFADICRGRSPSRGGAIFALSAWIGLVVWSCSVAIGINVGAIPIYDHVQHAGISLIGFCAGLAVFLFICDCLDRVWPPARGIAAPHPENAPFVEPRMEQSKALVEVRSTPVIVVPPAETISTAMDHAPAIRNPVSGFFNTVGTNAQINALENAGRLADATARAADAEAKGFAAIVRREDSLIEMRVRQQIAPELEQNKIEEQRERLREDTHRRNISTERRSKERWDAKRDTANARHGVEAAKRFKETKFKLGEKRAQARMADVDVDTATANAASRKLGTDPDAEAVDTVITLQALADNIRQELLAVSAEGKDTAWIRKHLARIESMLAKYD